MAPFGASCIDLENVRGQVLLVIRRAEGKRATPTAKFSEFKYLVVTFAGQLLLEWNKA